MILSEKIKQLRLISGLTQQEMADRMNITLQTYMRWENGKTKMTDEKVQLYANALGIDAKDIYTAPSKIVNLLQSVSNNTAERDVCGITVHNHYYGDNQLGMENELLRNQLADNQKLLSSKDEQIEALKTLINTLQKSS